MSWPNVYAFGYALPTFNWFAWRPVKTWNGQWAWLRKVQCSRVVKHDYLDGPDWEFWSYAHPTTNNGKEE